MKRIPLARLYFFFGFIYVLPLYAAIEYNIGEHHIYNDVQEDIVIDNIGGISNPVIVTLHSGTIDGNIVVFGGSPLMSTFRMLGGEIHGYLETMNGTTSEILGGTIAQRVGAFMQSKILIYGGDISHCLYANTGGEIHLWGTNFNYEYGEINDISGILTGKLQNGDPISSPFEIYMDPWETDPYFMSKIILHPIPEPATLSLLALGAFLTGRKRR